MVSWEWRSVDLDIDKTGNLVILGTGMCLLDTFLCLLEHVSSHPAATTEISRCGQFGGEIITDVLGAKPHYSKQYIGTNLLAEMNTVQQ